VYSFFLPVYSFWCMDDFGWGNTRLVIGEGKDKKVIVNEDDKFDDSMIPLKRFSGMWSSEAPGAAILIISFIEYEAEAWETQTHHTGVSGYPGSRSPSRAPGSRSRSPDGFGGSQAGDYYRDTNKVKPQRTGGSRLRSQPSNSNMSQYGQQQSMSQFAAPQLPFMPFAGGPGSVAGSDYGGQMPMGMPYQQTGGSMYGMMMPQHTGSVYGMPPPSMMGMGMYGGADGSQSVVGGPSMARPMSTFSMATSVNAFAGPSQNANPTDDELFNALRIYLSTQDLMTVTKKWVPFVVSSRYLDSNLHAFRTAREAIASRFPKADLSTRKDFLNESIDKILSQA
jgi:chitin synthase